MGSEGAHVFREAAPRRWTAVVAALLIVGAIVLQWTAARARCPGGSLRYWGICNVCGDLTKDKLKYKGERENRVQSTFRYVCEPCVTKAQGMIRAAKTDSEDWSAALRLGIQSVVLGVMALGLVMLRWGIPGPMPLWWETGALLVGPTHAAATLLGTPSSWFPLVAAGAVCACLLFGGGRDSRGVPPARPGAPPLII